VFLLGAPLLLVSLVPLGSEIAQRAGGIAKELTKNGGKDADQEAQLRLQVWSNAIDRGVQAGMFGLGPGPHLEIPPVLLAGRRVEDEPKNLEHPQLSSAPNFEAHNTLLDLFVQGGLLADLSFIWLLATCLLVTCRARAAWLTTLVLGLFIYGLFTLIIRHPVFWFAISLCQVAGVETMASPSVRSITRFGRVQHGSSDRIGQARIP
jgi:O-antigen ligase